MKILMLVPWLKMGHGVAQMVAGMAGPLAEQGVTVAVGCLEHDNFYDVPAHTVPPDAPAVAGLAEHLGADVVVAIGSPYFEVLPRLPAALTTVAYEAGDPTPGLFTADSEERLRIAANKRTNVYPHVGAVAAISSFIRHDIGWPDAAVIPLGIDDLPDLGPKPSVPPRDHRLRVGALTRLGPGEAHYKGRDQLLELRQLLVGSGDIEFELMGRGTEQDAADYRDAGFVVHLNATSAARDAYLRDVDVFVSTSLWEGTNLPLVEAAAMGTPALAFEIGAHPEFTPLVCTGVADMALLLRTYATDRDLLARHGKLCYSFVRERMVWEATAHGLLEVITAAQAGPARASRPARRSLLRSLRHEGIGVTARKLRGELGRRSVFRSIAHEGWAATARKAKRAITGRLG